MLPLADSLSYIYNRPSSVQELLSELIIIKRLVAQWSSRERARCQPGRGPTLWAFRWANQRFHEQPVKKEMVKRQFARRKMSRCWKLSLKLPWNDLLLHKSLYSFFLIMLSSPSKPSNKPTCRSRLIASAWSELSLPLPARIFFEHLSHLAYDNCFCYLLSVSPFSAFLLFLSIAICLTTDPSSSPTSDQNQSRWSSSWS